MESNRALELVTGQFDLVLLDPPYAKEQIAADIEKWLNESFWAMMYWLFVETDKSVDLPEEIAGLGIWKQKYMEFQRWRFMSDKIGLFAGSLTRLQRAYWLDWTS